MAFSNFLIILLMVSFNSDEAIKFPTFNSETFSKNNWQIPSNLKIWDNLKTTGEQIPPKYSIIEQMPKLSNPFDMLNNAFRRRWPEQQQIDAKNAALLQQNVNTDAFEKQIDNIRKITREIENTNKNIDRQKKLETFHKRLEAKYLEELRKEKFYKELARQHWHGPHFAAYKNGENQKVLNCRLNELITEMNKFPPEVKKGYNERKSEQDVKVEAQHERNIALLGPI